MRCAKLLKEFKKMSLMRRLTLRIVECVTTKKLPKVKPTESNERLINKEIRGC